MNLYEAWLQAKTNEDAAKRERLRVEALMLAQRPPSKEEGQEGFQEDGYKITYKSALNRKLDQKTIGEVLSKIPDILWPVRQTWEVDTAKLRALEQNEAVYYRIFAQAMTTTPAKTNIQVTKVEK